MVLDGSAGRYFLQAWLRNALLLTFLRCITRGGIVTALQMQGRGPSRPSCACGQSLVRHCPQLCSHTHCVFIFLFFVWKKKLNIVKLNFPSLWLDGSVFNRFTLSSFSLDNFKLRTSRELCESNIHLL